MASVEETGLRWCTLLRQYDGSVEDALPFRWARILSITAGWIFLRAVK
jgi:hypothetical protein